MKSLPFIYLRSKKKVLLSAGAPGPRRIGHCRKYAPPEIKSSYQCLMVSYWEIIRKAHFLQQSHSLACGAAGPRIAYRLRTHDKIKDLSFFIDNCQLVIKPPRWWTRLLYFLVSILVNKLFNGSLWVHAIFFLLEIRILQRLFIIECRYEKALLKNHVTRREVMNNSWLQKQFLMTT